MKKNIAVIAIASAALFNTACSDFLETTSNSEFTTDVVFSNPAYTKMAIMGIYSLMTSDEMYSSRISCTYAYNSDIEVVGADQNSYNDQGNRGVSNYFSTPSTAGYFERTWTTLYKAIERANQAIEQIPLSQVYQNGTAEEKTQMRGYLGEALALRSLYYFELVRLWGDVPMKLETTQANGSNFYLPATDRDLIYKQIIEDLQTAEAMIPWVNSGEYTNVRMNKGFIKGLVARISLYQGGYSMRNIAAQNYPMLRDEQWMDYYKVANEKCREIINHGANRLTETYVDYWKGLNSWTSTSPESLFEVAMGYERSGEMGYSLGIRFRTNAKYGFQNNANVVSTSPYYFYMFDRKDLRRDVSVAVYNYSNSSGEQKEVFTNNSYSWCIGKYDIRWMTSAFLADNKNVNGKRGYGINWVMMRYSDVLLMLAETENAIHGYPTPDAKAALKEVRKRAFSAEDQFEKVDLYVESLSTSEDFFNAIVDERAYEFGGEGIRKWDLVRWNLLTSKIEEQRDVYTKMLNHEAPYNTLPTALFIKYDANGEEIQTNEVNFYVDWGTEDIAGYDRFNFLSNWGESTKINTQLMIDRFSSGLLPENARGVVGRYIYPIQNTILAESGGLLENGYGY